MEWKWKTYLGMIFKFALYLAAEKQNKFETIISVRKDGKVLHFTQNNLLS